MSERLAHPTVATVMAIHAEVLAAHGGLAGLRDQALLESAVAAPQATMMGAPFFPIPWKSRRLIFSIFVAIIPPWTATNGRRWRRVWSS